MGFGAQVKGKNERLTQILAQALPEDLIKYGLIPEFVGRLPVVATLEQLDQEALVRILKEPKNSLVRQYQAMFEFEDVQLQFTPVALELIAKEAIKRNVGARGLRIILEELMLDLMYDVPSDHDIKECLIDEDVVLRYSQPLAVYKKAG
jgi:ATP-dependent Clp protease ATP-binding subunit ClpX